MSKIIVRDIAGEHSYSLQETVTVGRHPHSVICLHDAMVSKHHARINKIKNYYIYEDLNSSNGSFFDGVQVYQHRLSDGDIITLGKVNLTFYELSEEEKMASMVNISRVSVSNEVQDRIEVSGLEQFQPEDEVSDLAVLRSDYEKLRLGSKLMHTLGVHRDLSIVLSKAADELLRVFHADRCMIMLYHKQSDELIPKVVRSCVEGDQQLMVSGSVLHEVQQSKLAVLLSDASQDERFSQSSSLIMQGIRSVMCSPIVYGEEFCGVVHLDSQQGSNCFTRKDLQLLTSIVHYIALAIANADLIHQVEQEARFKAQFERLLSPSVAELVMSGAVKLDKGGELRDITILFADIRGFTRLSHTSEPTRIVAMLNRYFEMLVEIVFKHGGTVDKYIGDEIMVLFGAPLAVVDAEDKAVQCALEMQIAMEQFSIEQEKKHEEPVQIGIGINSGEVVVGSIGSSRTMQYTCIGDAVNVASRLTTKAKAGQVVISDETKSRLHDDFKYESLPNFSLKGIDDAIQAWIVTT
ncbi:MAG: adenylate/guanylate cyclase domain-containing protein [Mariprofundaceae bacterium]